MKVRKTATGGQSPSTTGSRRQAVAVMIGAWRGWLEARAATNGAAPLRLAISESLVSDVNSGVSDTTEEILRRALASQLDAVALNVAEYRQIAKVLDPSQIITEAGAAGLEQCFLLVKRSSGIRLYTLKALKMCAATAWLAGILDEAHLGQNELFFSSVTMDTKASRVVPPVFFWSGRCMPHLETELRYDVRVESPGSERPDRDRQFSRDGGDLLRFPQRLPRRKPGPVRKDLPFQFESLVVKDAGCLTPALAILDAERSHGRPGSGSHNVQ